jgi:hypothetical protein
MQDPIIKSSCALEDVLLPLTALLPWPNILMGHLLGRACSLVHGYLHRLLQLQAFLADMGRLAWQVSGHIYNEDGGKVLALSGAWNSHLDMVRCDEDGDPLPDAQTTRLWQVFLPSACPSLPHSCSGFAKSMLTSGHA